MLPEAVDSAGTPSMPVATAWTMWDGMRPMRIARLVRSDC